jgi:hypothetical protein
MCAVLSALHLRICPARIDGVGDRVSVETLPSTPIDTCLKFGAILKN